MKKGKKFCGKCNHLNDGIVPKCKKVKYKSHEYQDPITGEIETLHRTVGTDYCHMKNFNCNCPDFEQKHLKVSLIERIKRYLYDRTNKNHK